MGRETDRHTQITAVYSEKKSLVNLLSGVVLNFLQNPPKKVGVCSWLLSRLGTSLGSGG